MTETKQSKEILVEEEGLWAWIMSSDKKAKSSENQKDSPQELHMGSSPPNNVIGTPGLPSTVITESPNTIISSSGSPNMIGTSGSPNMIGTPGLPSTVITGSPNTVISPSGSPNTPLEPHSDSVFDSQCPKDASKKVHTWVVYLNDKPLGFATTKKNVKNFVKRLSIQLRNELLEDFPDCSVYITQTDNYVKLVTLNRYLFLSYDRVHHVIRYEKIQKIT